MAKAKITIIGEIEKFKVHEDGTVNIIIEGDTSAAVPNGLKELGVRQRFVLFGTTLINITFMQPGKGNSVLA